MRPLVILLMLFVTVTASSEEWHESHECLTNSILFEARNQGEEGMRAVAFVTMNRVSDMAYPNTVCDVVYQRKQFSWTHMLNEMTPINESVEELEINAARRIAADALTGRLTDDTTQGALWYHAKTVKPKWSDSYQLTAVIGDHIFYASEQRRWRGYPIDR